MDHQDTINLLYQNTFCIKPMAKHIYFIFLKQLILKLLDNTTNYIYLSMSDIYLNKYQESIPQHNRIIYTINNFIPMDIPDNMNIIYFYHPQTHNPTIEQQFELLEILSDNPNIKYVYVGDITKLLNSTRIKLFHYYLHFEIPKSRWRGINSHRIIERKISRSITNKYISQTARKKKVINPINIYDYYLLHDFVLAETKIICFNKQKFTPKKKHINKPTIINYKNNLQNEVRVQTKYIYMDSHKFANNLLMPDGSKENFKKIVEKYKDVVVV